MRLRLTSTSVHDTMETIPDDPRRALTDRHPDEWNRTLVEIDFGRPGLPEVWRPDHILNTRPVHPWTTLILAAVAKVEGRGLEAFELFHDVRPVPEGYDPTCPGDIRLHAGGWYKSPSESVAALVARAVPEVIRALHEEARGLRPHPVFD